MSDWIQTFSGRRFWPLEPKPEDVCIEDIAHALSMLCRYNGHCRIFYSVAEHSIHVQSIMARTPIGKWDRQLQLAALLHDASEAYLADVPSPVKPYLIGYKEAEAKVMAAVHQAFGLEDPRNSEPFIKRIDTRIRANEAELLMPVESDPWHKVFGNPYALTIMCYEPAKAETLFLEAAGALLDGREHKEFPDVP